MINRKSLIGALVGLLLLTGIIGANLVMAGGRQDTGRSARSEKATSDADNDNENLECPAQGLPACAGQMNDEKSEGPENEKNEEAEEANEKGEDSENEAEEADNDKHEDAEGADHQCPPDCDTENGEEG